MNSEARTVNHGPNKPWALPLNPQTLKAVLKQSADSVCNFKRHTSQRVILPKAQNPKAFQDLRSEMSQRPGTAFEVWHRPPAAAAGPSKLLPPLPLILTTPQYNIIQHIMGVFDISRMGGFNNRGED